MHLILLLSLLLVAFPAAARTVEDEQVWLNATMMGSAKGRLIYFLEAQPRLHDGGYRPAQLLLRGALGWKVSEAVSLYGGYLHVVLPRTAQQDRNEERLFTQLSWTIGKIGRGTLSSRTRLEHRRLSTGGDTGWRVRDMVRYVHPIGDGRRVRALAWAEPFVNLNTTDWGQRRGFDQLRSFGGLEVPLADRSTLEVGYMNQRVNEPAGVIRSGHTASFTFFFRL